METEALKTQEIENRVRKAISTVTAGHVGAAADADLELDSLDRIEVGMALEDEFGLAVIEDAEAEGRKSVADWFALVQERLGDDA